MRRLPAPSAAWLALLALAAGGCLNLAVVDPDRVYRSAQPDPDELAELIEDYGIETVVNLRGAAPGAEWFEDEVRVCRTRGVTHLNVRLSGRRRPKAEEVLALLDVFDRAPAPLLLHCSGGADRSGLAAALWRIHVLGESPEEAADELSIWRGHLGWLTGTGELSDFLELYAETGGGKPLRTWLTEDYPR